MILISNLYIASLCESIERASCFRCKRISSENIIVLISFLYKESECSLSKSKKILIEEIGDKDLSVVYNINIGHATPRCIIPFGVEAEVNVDKQVVVFDN